MLLEILNLRDLLGFGGRVSVRAYIFVKFFMFIFFVSVLFCLNFIF